MLVIGKDGALEVCCPVLQVLNEYLLFSLSKATGLSNLGIWQLSLRLRSIDVLANNGFDHVSFQVLYDIYGRILIKHLLLSCGHSALDVPSIHEVLVLELAVEILGYSNAFRHKDMLLLLFLYKETTSSFSCLLRQAGLISSFVSLFLEIFDD